MNARAPAVAGTPRLLLAIEGFALLAVALIGYWQIGASWWLFAALVMAPDLGMVGYLRGPRLGAMLYNALHFTPVPLVLGAYGFLWNAPLALAVALIWLAHIGMDRALGYGLKYQTAFRDTHLGRIGK